MNSFVFKHYNCTVVKSVLIACTFVYKISSYGIDLLKTLQSCREHASRVNSVSLFQYYKS